MNYIRTSAEAEQNAVEVMRRFGFHDAASVPTGPDGGVDVVSRRGLAQVKWRGAAAGRPDMQRLFGARGQRMDLELFFFAASGFSTPAITYADQVGIRLFTYSPTGEVEPINRCAHEAAAAPVTKSTNAPRLTAAARKSKRKEADQGIYATLFFGLVSFYILAHAIFIKPSTLLIVISSLILLACVAGFVSAVRESLDLDGE